MERLNLDKVKILAAAATLAMFAGVACAEARTEVFGAVNTAIMHTSDGNQDSTLFTQNQYYPSTLGLKSAADLTKCVTMGGTSEVQFNVNSSRLVSQIQNTTDDTYLLTVRRLEAWASAGMWGKLSLGYGDAASWGITDMSFAGTNQTVIGVNVQNTAGGMYFFQKGTARAVNTNPRVDRVFDSLNGIGQIDDYTGTLIQKNRIRYDTGCFYGFTLGVSFGSVADRLALGGANADSFAFDDNRNQRTFTDVALRYRGDWQDFMFGAGIAWAGITRDGVTTENDPAVGTATRGERVWSGSIAGEHKPTGINLAVAGGVKRKMVETLNNYKFWYVQLGKHFCFTEFGKTNIALDYFQGKDARLNSDKGKSWGVGVSQDLNKVNTAVYASVRNYRYNPESASAVRYDSVTALNAGLLFKFGAML